MKVIIKTTKMATTRVINSPTDGYSRFTNDFQGPNEILASQRDGEIIREMDLPNELGSTQSLSQSNHSVEMYPPGEQSADIDLHWEMNYHEAAIFLEKTTHILSRANLFHFGLVDQPNGRAYAKYTEGKRLEEGENNEKFDSHPKSANALPAYLLVHNRWYHGLDVGTSILLLALAFVEEPAVPLFSLPVGAHGSIELLCLFVIGGELALKLRWIGWKALLRHKRTMIKCGTLMIMVVEAFVVLIRQSSHFRVTRALRPIFIVDTKYCGGVRRFIRQILQSLPPILDMMGLLLFFVSIYSLLGYFLFSEDKYFRSLSDSFFSLFVLLTTANFPDVMMPSYARSKWNAVFFISYLCIVLYVLMNLMLAVVYETFTRIEMDKFKKLLLHKRQACKHAFRLLVTRQDPNNMGFKHFHGLIKYYAPNKSTRDIILMFKHLGCSESGAITQDQFLNVYDAIMLKWRGQFTQTPWYHTLWHPVQNLCQLSHDLIAWPYFDYVVYTLIVGNLIAMIIRTFEFQEDNVIESARLFCASWDSILVLCLCAIEVLLKVVGLGISRYFDSGWNIFDFVVTFLGLLGVVILSIFPSFTYIVVLRPLRLIRLFKIKKRYRDVFGTVVILSPLMCSTAVVMLVMFYFFAIIGMELFAGYDMRNCCVNTSVEEFYRFNPNGSLNMGYYYLNTFENLLTSGVTLFELTVVNNWFIVMNGYVAVQSQYSRVYFIIFYLFTMVVLTIVVASVLQAFRFRIHYKRHTSKKDEEKMLHEEVHLNWEEVHKWIQDFQVLEALRVDLAVGATSTFIGCRPRNREVLQRKMYRREIDEWMREDDERIKAVNDEGGNQEDVLIIEGRNNRRSPQLVIQ